MNTDILTRVRCPGAKVPILFLTAVALLGGCIPVPMSAPPGAPDRLGRVLGPGLIERASDLRHALLPVEAEFYRAQTALVDVQRRIEAQPVAINAAMGLAPDAPWRARGELDAPPAGDLTVDGLLDHVEERRLDLRAMRSAMCGKRAAARAALWRASTKCSRSSARAVVAIYA